MGRALRMLAVAGIVFAIVAAPAAAQTAVIDISDFVPANFEDVNGDGVPDLGDLPPGERGIWDDTVGALTPEEFFQRVDTTGVGFDLNDEGSEMRGPCGGVAISYDADGLSIDAVLDLADNGPSIDIYTGEQAFTSGNPMKVDTNGTVAYFGFTLDEGSGLSSEGNQPNTEYGEPRIAYHDHQWQLDILEISADFGGDPNAGDDNRNAGLIELSEELPFSFAAKVKARGAIIDLWGPERLPDFDSDSIAGIAGGQAFCYGEGWVQFEGGTLFSAPGALAGALALAGFAGLLFNARPAQSWRA